MPIPLPSSQEKTAPSAGAPFASEELAFAAELTESRRKLPGALERLAAEPPERPLAVLAASSGQAVEVEGDAQLRGASLQRFGVLWTP